MSLFTYQTRNYGGSLPAINWAHPVTRGLIGAFLPGHRYNIADGRFCTNQYATVATVGSRQRGRAIVAGAYQTPEPANASSVHAKFDRSVLTALAVTVQDTATNAGYSFFRGNGSSAPGWMVGLWGGSVNGPHVTMGSWTANFDIGSGYTRTPHVIVLAADGTTATCYADGIAVGSSSYTAPTYQYSSARSVFFGSLFGTNGASPDRPSLGLFWNRALTPNEIKLVSENPEIVFRPIARAYFVDSGSASTEIGAGIGEAGAAGLGASVAIETAIAAAIGQASATGLQASIVEATAIAASLGDASASGVSASVTLGAAIDASIGSASASGLAATITLETSVSASVAQASASGLSASIDLGANVSASIAEAGATGLSAGIATTTNVVASIGPATAIGLAALITSGGQIVLGSLSGTGKRDYPSRIRVQLQSRPARTQSGTRK